MISAKTGTHISIRSIEFTGIHNLDGQARGENIITIVYHTHTKIIDPKTLRHRYVVVAENTIKLNMQFADQELFERLVQAKILATELIQERHEQEAEELKDAFAKIGRDSKPVAPGDIAVQGEADNSEGS
jgi:hypothetical protein